ncbi:MULTISPECIES: pyroglutamyl-peptidase I [unclassified Paenibacillus]|uniref:pyroglutamyl-peptidase I n=1 Tax=unclassified Paenibacillus TaxID=185978 RepID=UPI000954B799|nr:MULTISPECIES: pyroglutamyl-peptidase I [unclassified Paenibacillus]ASS65783.1 pyroglutamyl-peptidase I [Paenibacillus sp. RUD330]SIQ23873.1 pyroglutamyl-peptidase [Paenibacillus sp. RU4X]SIQ45589.1 pyroglutamyl-peptidase [Paenibacillus sp. RU4T]
MIKVLVSGFEPFGGDDVNPTGWLMEKLKEERLEGVELRTVLLPVHFDECGDRLIGEMDAFKPHAVIACGLAKGRTAITPERIAVNVKDVPVRSHGDNRGARPSDEPIAEEGPDGLFSTLPVRAMTQRLAELGIPCEISNTAGTYICNNTMYRALHHIRSLGLPVLAGFVHFPASAEMAAAQPSVPFMPQEMMLQGLTAMIGVVANLRQKEGS